MDEPFVPASTADFLPRLAQLICAGRRLRETLASDPSALPATRLWQRDCAAAVNQLSGGRKVHWLARAYSGALLVRSPAGAAVGEADPAEIVDRIVGVLEQAVAALAPSGTGPGTQEHPDPSLWSARFEFVHDPALRPILGQAYQDSRAAFDRGEFDLALITTCGILDAILTYALEAPGQRGRVSAWSGTAARALSFEERIAAAEESGLIRGGCARLPAVARNYRDLAGEDGELRGEPRVSARDARLAGQVLHVVMRDLNPGR
jgi:hypothetical protein